MKVKDISICPDPDCVCCALERKLMETVEASGVDTSTGAVALAHALARQIYPEVKGDVVSTVATIEFFGIVTGKAIGRLAGNDRPG